LPEQATTATIRHAARIARICISPPLRVLGQRDRFGL
jgi:hypothetical protein